MKFFGILLLFAMALFGGDVVWQSSYVSAMKKAHDETKPVLVFMNQPGCGSCEFMKENVFTDPQVVDYLNSHYIPVSLDIHKNDAPEALQVKMTPVFHFVRSDGSKIQDTLMGGKTAPFFLKLLKKADEAK